MDKKAILKDIIRALHRGLPPAAAAERVLKEAGFITTAEIAAIEQELMNEGIPPAEIQKFCNVHALIFEKAIQPASGTAATASVVELLKAENKAIAERVEELVERLTKQDWPGASQTLASFDVVIRHYVKKEQALFPFLEKRGFTGPSQVMWGKHDEVRRLLKDARSAIAHLPGAENPATVKTSLIDPLLAEIKGMIDKEELILFPTTLEKLTAEDLEAARQSFIDLERAGVVGELNTAAALAGGLPQTAPGPGEVVLPSGKLSLTELTRILNALPVDVSFVDVHDEVKYFSETAERIFPRTRSVIGRNVKNCHPPKSLDAVQRILAAFKSGRKDTVDFWINLGGKMITIRYIAIRDEKGVYLGTLEVSQDVTGPRALQGEKRLLDEKDI